MSHPNRRALTRSLRAPRAALSAALVVATAAVVVSCAPLYDYANAAIMLEPGTGVVAVAVFDQRPYVLDGDEDPEYAAIERSGFGIPYSKDTDSGAPLAAEMTAALVAGLQSAGYTARGVRTSHDNSRAEVIGRLEADGAPRALLITLRDWQTDVYFSVDLTYDLDVEVLESGNTLAIETALFDETFAGGANGARVARREAPIAFAQHMATLLTDAEIQAALTTD